MTTVLETKKVFGVALYLELRREGFTIQHLFTPYMPWPEDNGVIPATLLFRQVSKDKPNRSWTYSPVQGPGITYDARVPSGKRLAMSDNTTGLEPLYSKLRLICANASSGGWTIYREPLTLGITYSDAGNIRSLRATPVNLLKRLSDARLDAGFNASLWEETK